MPTTDLPDSDYPETDPAPQQLPVLPLPDGVIFPDMVVTVTMQSPEAQQILASTQDGRLLLVPRIDGIYARVGVIATIEDQDSLPDGSPTVTLRAHARARVGSGVVGATNGLWVDVHPITEPRPDAETLRLATEYRAAATNLLERVGGRRMAGMVPPTDEPGTLADSIAYWPDLSLEQRVELLEAIDVKVRLELATEWVKEALAEREVRDKIQQDVSNDLESSQREAILRRQMAAIQTELGEADGDAIADYRAKLEELKAADEAGQSVAEGVISAIEKEINRLERTGNESMEANWIRTWLDTVFDIPWTSRSVERLDLGQAREILDADHTGLSEVKDRLVEHLAVRKLRTDRDITDDVGSRRGGVILALVGPPGVGKTSLGESVARSLGRDFVRLALGGIRDEAEIRGHRRTYVGARPGRLVAALTEAGSMNPVILLDEIDKVSGGWQGDPSAALLEVLDPAQNHSFRDHYLEFELDLSDVVFIATANVIDTIPGPLLDRLELISLDGYTETEKTTIARDHLLPRLVKRNGLRPDEVEITDEALAGIAADYTREAGVRRLERQLDKAIRKTATKIASQALDELTQDPAQDADELTRDPAQDAGELTRDPALEELARDPAVEELARDPALEELTRDPAQDADGGNPEPEDPPMQHDPIVITEDDLADLLGKPIPREQVTDRIDRPGIATGLAVTGAGGDVLFVETALVDGDGEAILTGQLGDVMKESAAIVRSLVSTKSEGLGYSMPENKRVHVHFPAGAVPKDGPSAGVTMTTALASLLSGRKVRSDLAMTGEVTLQGRVLPIGGVKQKVLAAHRAGLTTVILPKDNGQDLDDIPDDVREAMTIELVADVDRVLEIALT
ncbi:MAG: endopeptidase La [Acidimicrobiales bacterium]